MKAIKNSNLVWRSGLGAIFSLIFIFTVGNQSVNIAEGQGTTENEIYIPYAVNNSEINAYYISPDGNDQNSGTSPGNPWATFNRAWEDIMPGDTLILMDGVYYQTLAPNKRNGEPGKPITIKAQNDGQAIIDGQNQRLAVSLAYQPNEWWVGSYFVIEGIVARNSSESVYEIMGSNNILRRVSGYDANTDTNSHVFSIAFGDNNLLEDCVAAGTGRKMIMVFGDSASGNVIRRCLARFDDWRGLDSCHGHWPWGDGIQIYNSTDTIIENSIAIGAVSGWQMSIQNQDPDKVTFNNKLLGSISINAGVNWDGQLRFWGPGQVDPVSSPNQSCGLWTSSWYSSRAGLALYGQNMDNLLIQDSFLANNAGVGFSTFSTNQNVNGTLNRVTIVDNGLDAPEGIGVSIHPDLDGFTVTNSKIDGTGHNGSGARLQYRYENGVLLDGTNGKAKEPLWPWPMQERILAELGFNITAEITPLLHDANVVTGLNQTAQPRTAANFGPY